MQYSLPFSAINIETVLKKEICIKKYFISFNLICCSIVFITNKYFVYSFDAFMMQQQLDPRIIDKLQKKKIYFIIFFCNINIRNIYFTIKMFA